jgi:serine/threonine protein kinase
LKYFSTHRQVLRSYDSRFRSSNRSPQIYLSDDWQAFGGGGDVKVVAKFPENSDISTFNHGGSYHDDCLWSDTRGCLLIIATPYRIGGHVAKSVKAFLPVIDQLELMHQKGFVHGDIRAFNTVFNEQEQEQGSNKSCLIDFDFGGPIGERTCYPEGYRQFLSDGLRIGREKEKIEKWHDWYALGQLIFNIHEINLENVSEELQLKFFHKSKFWTRIRKEVVEEEALFRNQIKELKSFLNEIDKPEWQVSPSLMFSGTLSYTFPTPGTHKGATGSPPEKKHQN